MATDATPEEVAQGVRNCRLIGRRFRLAHVHFGREIIEVATFRGGGREEDRRRRAPHRERHDRSRQSLRHAREDALAPGLHRQRPLLQYRGFLRHRLCGRARRICRTGCCGSSARSRDALPGRPGAHAARRAVRLQTRLSTSTPRASSRCWSWALLRDIRRRACSRRCSSCFSPGLGLCAFEKLRHYDLFAHLFPATDECLDHEDQDFPSLSSARAGQHRRRIQEEKPVTPAFLFAVLLWEPCDGVSRSCMPGI